MQLFDKKTDTVKPVYNELGYNQAYGKPEHRSHRFLHQIIGYNEFAYNQNRF
jgi:hypothetical protein